MADMDTPQDWEVGNARFRTTHWTLVLNAGGDGPERQQALEQFCRMYWHPIYAFIRRKGTNPEDARDRTQDFFALLLERGWLADVERRDIRFSTLLLTILKRFLATAHRDATTQKRGGGAVVFSLDAAQAEAWFGAEPTTGVSPEKTFARRWALAVLESAKASLGSKLEAAGKADYFSLLEPYLSREPEPGDYEALVAQLGINANAIGVAVHRLRHQYRDALRDELGAGRIAAAQVDEDLRYLADALR